MVEGSNPTYSMNYYYKNRDKYKKGGKYYKYIPIRERVPCLKLEVRKGNFLIYFD
jgi:hypothetical protein